MKKFHIPTPSVGKQILMAILLSIFVSNLTGVAQENKTTPVTFGITAGLNHSTFKFDERSRRLGFPESSQTKIGFGFGISLVVPVIKSVSFQPEYIWNNIGGGLKDADVDYRLNYLSFPIMVNWKVVRNLSFVAGPQFDLLINARLENEDETSDVTKEIENRGVNVVTGIHYYIAKSLSVSGRYVHGLNHIGFMFSSGTPEYQSRIFQLSLIYHWSF